jgi:hypothetical protein
LLEIPGVYKIPANESILVMLLFLSFQDICLGCCTALATREALVHGFAVKLNHNTVAREIVWKIRAGLIWGVESGQNRAKMSHLILLSH